MNKKQSAQIAVIVVGILTLTLTNLLFGLTWPLLIAKAGPTLPPRKVPPSNVQPGSDNDDDDGGPVGAYIELHTQPVMPGVWSVVQWQDSDGHWHNVDGWQGDLDSTGTRRWWVEAKDFNTGPFRWQIFNGPDDQLLATSTTFTLPHEANKVLEVEVSP